MRVGFESPSSFEGPGTSCSARVRTVLPRPSAAMSIRKRWLSSSMHTPPTSNIHQVPNLCPSKYTKMHIIASDFSKISRGSMPPDPPSGARASPKLLPSVRKLTGAWKYPCTTEEEHKLETFARIPNFSVCCAKANGHGPFHIIPQYFSALRQLALVVQ